MGGGSGGADEVSEWEAGTHLPVALFLANGSIGVGGSVDLGAQVRSLGFLALWCWVEYTQRRG